MALNLSLLAIEPPSILRTQLGYDVAQQTQLQITRPTTDVVIFPTSVVNAELLQWLVEQNKSNPACQFIIVENSHPSPNDLLQIINKISVFHIFETWTTPDLEPTIMQALEKARQIHLYIDLEKTVREQNQQMVKLSEKLESSVKNRQKDLMDVRQKNQIALQRWISLRKAALVVQESSDPQELQKQLKECFSDTLEIHEIHILFDSEPVKKDWSQNFSLFKSAFKVAGSDVAAQIIFLRSKEKPFSRDETDFLSKLTEFVNLAAERMNQVGEAQKIKQLWEQTFNAITDPVILINNNYEIVQSNQAFEKQKVGSGRKCYQALFDRQQPCAHCQLGQSFQIEVGRHDKKTFQTSSYPVELIIPELHQSRLTKSKFFVNQYTDVSENLRLEKKILESSKLAEIGTIGSSIAHELNNPLGGILSFVQLIKMDMKDTHPFWTDLIEMEKGALRCKDIVQNLLAATREDQSQQHNEFDLREVLQSGIAILEMSHLKSHLDIKVNMSKNPFMIKAHQGQMAQALQMFLSEIIDQLKNQKNLLPTFMGSIDITLNDHDLIILDNSPGARELKGLGAQIAIKIFHENNADLEFSFPSKNLRKAKISFPV